MSDIGHSGVVPNAPPGESGAATGSIETVSDMQRLVMGTIETLTAKGVAPGDIAPLLHLWTALGDFTGPLPGQTNEEKRRNDTPASAAVLARACAVIDLLIQGGQDAEKASQSMARQLLATGVKLPEAGGDARGWRRLEEWHNRLRFGTKPDPARDEYHRFGEEIASIAPHERIQRVVDERLWDRRKRS